MPKPGMLDLIAEQENLAQMRLVLAEIDREKCEVLIRKIRAGPRANTADDQRVMRLAKMWKSKKNSVASLSKMLLELSTIRNSVETKDAGVTMNLIRAAFNSEHKNIGDVVEDVRETQEDAFRTAAILESLESVTAQPIIDSPVSDTDLMRELDEYLAADESQDLSVAEPKQHRRAVSNVRFANPVAY